MLLKLAFWAALLLSAGWYIHNKLKFQDNCIGFNSGSLLCGKAVYSKKTFEHDLVVNGNFSGTEVALQAAIINGTAYLSKSHVHGALTVNGMVEAQSSFFDGPVSVQGYFIGKSIAVAHTINLCGMLKITDSQMQAITVKNSKEKPAHIYLYGSTHVAADIVFVESNGIVHADKTVTIAGKIVGGSRLSN
ncbi:hypothetical protein H0X48_01345 [Candidatus Dependentiae bacterium]|nr:hypothetical protein [Candidatus Dependentiae bacterium]